MKTQFNFRKHTHIALVCNTFPAEKSKMNIFSVGEIYDDKVNFLAEIPEGIAIDIGGKSIFLYSAAVEKLEDPLLLSETVKEQIEDLKKEYISKIRDYNPTSIANLLSFIKIEVTTDFKIHQVLDPSKYDRVLLILNAFPFLTLKIAMPDMYDKLDLSTITNAGAVGAELTVNINGKNEKVFVASYQLLKDIPFFEHFYVMQNLMSDLPELLVSDKSLEYVNLAIKAIFSEEPLE